MSRLSPMMRDRLTRIVEAGEAGDRGAWGRTLDALQSRGLVDWKANPADPLSIFRIWTATDAGREALK